MKTTSKTSTSESGLVSIIVTLIIMVVLSLIVIGFANLTRRDQRQTLDRQLNTQALYAAETGVNDAIDKLQNVSSLSATSYTGCNDFVTAAGLNPVIDAANNISYTCLLVDPSPEILTYTNVTQYNPRVVPVNASSAISSIKISWQNPTGTAGDCTQSATSATNPANGAWAASSPCPNGMLRVDILPGSSITSRASVIAANMAFFAFPPTSGGSGTVNYSVLNTGARVNGTCSSSVPASGRMCNITITNLGQTSYYLRLQSLYRVSDIDITAQGVSGDLALSGAQAVVDVTGKAQDVLKRIQIRQPLFATGDVPSSALNVGSSLCKLLTVIPNTNGGTLDGCLLTVP
jgi:Tfp pilus assembly protein PilX